MIIICYEIIKFLVLKKYFLGYSLPLLLPLQYNFLDKLKITLKKELGVKILSVMKNYL